MKPLRLPSLWVLSLLCCLPVAARTDGPYSMELLVRGAPLAEYRARGTSYVEAAPGADYAIRLSNRTAERVAVALAVDGLNTIDAKTTSAAAAAKWILGPYETITIEGWQTDSGSARRFYFTTEPRSYGAWLGRTRDLGLVSAAFFREVAPRAIAEELERRDAPPAPAAAAGRARGEAQDALKSEAALGKDLAATGIGERVEHRVRRERFEAEDEPAAVLGLRYEYHDALLALGVLPRPCPAQEDPLTRRESARGFESFEFAPDPFRPRK